MLGGTRYLVQHVAVGAVVGAVIGLGGQVRRTTESPPSVALFSLLGAVFAALLAMCAPLRSRSKGADIAGWAASGALAFNLVIRDAPRGDVALWVRVLHYSALGAAGGLAMRYVIGRIATHSGAEAE